eukprot:Clim_evm35s11 gene=Clim_evmTU35s11
MDTDHEPTIERLATDFCLLSEKDQNSFLKTLIPCLSSKQHNILYATLEESLKRDFIKDLPQELVTNILSRLDFKTLCAVSAVSKTWHKRADTDSIWEGQLRAVGLPLQDYTDNVVELAGEEKERTAPHTKRHTLMVPNRRQQSLAKMDIDHLSDMDHDYHYKEIYGRYLQLHRNWLEGKYKHLALSGHTKSVFCVELLDHRRLLSGAFDHSVRLWDIKKKQCIRTFQGHDGGVCCLQFNYPYLVTGSSDRTLRVWDFKKAETKVVLKGHQAEVTCVYWQGERPIVSGGCDFNLRVWDVKTGLATAVLQGHSDYVIAVTYDDRQIISGSFDSTAIVWSWSDYTIVHRLEGHASGIRDVKMTDKYFITASQDTTLRLWNRHDGVEIRQMVGHTGEIWKVVLTDDSGTFLLSAGFDRHVRYWDTSTGNCLAAYKTPHRRAITCIDVAGALLVTSSFDKTISVFDFDPGRYPVCNV